ncbi:hypothetical protein I6E31_06225 [Fusobacterium varium]|nr:hypothetical protein [Fusobacterium varium]
MKILNLSNHTLTVEQTNELDQQGYNEIVELSAEDKKLWGQLVPDAYKEVCDNILAKYKADAIHLAGFPPATVYVALKTLVPCLYAYSPRVCVETPMPDGSINKNYVFKHMGFYRY